MSAVEYMHLTDTNGLTVAQWLSAKGIIASVEADDRLRVSITEQLAVGAAEGAESKIEKVAADVLVTPGLYLVVTHVPTEDRHFLRVTGTLPKPEEDEPASVG